MKFELAYANGAKVTVELPDAELAAILDTKVKASELATAEAARKIRGIPATVKIVP